MSVTQMVKGKKISQEQMEGFKKHFEAEQKRVTDSTEEARFGAKLMKEDLMDEVDLSAAEIIAEMDLRLKTRNTLYLKKINQALRRIQDGTFGLCEDCEEPMSLKRLESRPTATLCIECKEAQEHSERIHIDGHVSKSLGMRLGFAT